MKINKFLYIFSFFMLSGCIFSRIKTKTLDCSISYDAPNISIVKLKTKDQEGMNNTITNVTVIQTLTGRCK